MVKLTFKRALIVLVLVAGAILSQAVACDSETTVSNTSTFVHGEWLQTK